MSNIWEAYAIRYATLENRSSAANFIGGDIHERSGALDFFIWVVRSSDGKVFVVDTGFGAEAAVRRQRQFITTPARGLSRLGIDPSTVENVVITHLHYDHVGGFADFPKAKFHLQDDEMSYATGRHMCHAFFNHAYEVEEVVSIVREVYKGRVIFHDGDVELAPGLSVHKLGGHTKGLQCVRVHTRIGWVVLASDSAHLYANMLEERPFPIVHDAAAMVEAWGRLRELADSENYIVPGHDPLVMKRYAPPSAELAGLVVRLDAEPRGMTRAE